MALWTPYAEEAALDLSKPTKKEERTPAFSYPIGNDELQYGYAYSQQFGPLHRNLPVTPGHPAYYVEYPYPNCTMLSAQMSPVSSGSTCSHEATLASAPSLSPHSVQGATLSPPESPVSQTHRLYADVDELSDDPDFQSFERNALRVMAEKNGGALLGNNPRMRRAVRSTNQDAANDSYRKQRERNNFAAKQSRDRRKLREIHLALKVSYLKNQVASLKEKLSVNICGRCRQ